MSGGSLRFKLKLAWLSRHKSSAGMLEPAAGHRLLTVTLQESGELIIQAEASAGLTTLTKG